MIEYPITPAYKTIVFLVIFSGFYGFGAAATSFHLGTLYRRQYDLRDP